MPETGGGPLAWQTENLTDAAIAASDDPVQRVLAWRRANERREALAGAEPVRAKKATPPPAPCHYCGGPAGTRDHIVPRSALRRAGLINSQVPNVVPACERCNQLKADRRSDCDCTTCLTAWAVLGPLERRIPVFPVKALAALIDGDSGDEAWEAAIETLRVHFGRPRRGLTQTIGEATL